MCAAVLTCLDSVHDQKTHEKHRLVILRSNGRDVLVRELSRGPSLPAVEVPRWTRTIEQVTSCVRDNLGLSTALLDSDRSSRKEEGLWTTVLEGFFEEMPVTGFRWTPVEGIERVLSEDEASFVAESHRRAVGANKVDAGPFARLGWIQELKQWIEDVTGGGDVLRFEQLNGSADACLLRCDSVDRTFWYKALGQGNSQEFTNTAALSRWLGSYLPRICAIDPDRKAWLMESGGDCTLRGAPELAIWASVARHLASFQIESIPHASKFLQLECIDLRNAALLQLIEPFFELMDGLMQEQVKNPPAPLTKRELREAAGALREAIEELQTLELPDVIGNSDFGPGNILVSNDRITFTDWAEAHVGNPLLTIENLVAHYTKNYPAEMHQAEFLRAAYREQWEAVYPDTSIGRAFDLGPLVGVYANAIAGNSWRDPASLAVEGRKGYLRARTRIMRREAAALLERRTHAQLAF